MAEATVTQGDLVAVMGAAHERLMESGKTAGLYHSDYEGHSHIRAEVEELFDLVRAGNGYEDYAVETAIEVASLALKYALMIKVRRRALGLEPKIIPAGGLVTLA